MTRDPNDPDLSDWPFTFAMIAMIGIVLACAFLVVSAILSAVRIGIAAL